jgi:hypothetical protein
MTQAFPSLQAQAHTHTHTHTLTRDPAAWSTAQCSESGQSQSLRARSPLCGPGRLQGIALDQRHPSERESSGSSSSSSSSSSGSMGHGGTADVDDDYDDDKSEGRGGMDMGWR